MSEWVYPNLFDDPETGCVADALQARWPSQFHMGNRWLAIEMAAAAIAALRQFDTPPEQCERCGAAGPTPHESTCPAA